MGNLLTFLCKLSREITRIQRRFQFFYFFIAFNISATISISLATAENCVSSLHQFFCFQNNQHVNVCERMWTYIKHVSALSWRFSIAVDKLIIWKLGSVWLRWLHICTQVLGCPLHVLNVLIQGKKKFNLIVLHICCDIRYKLKGWKHNRLVW